MLSYLNFLTEIKTNTINKTQTSCRTSLYSYQHCVLSPFACSWNWFQSKSVCYCCGLIMTPSVRSFFYQCLSSRLLKVHFSRSPTVLFQMTISFRHPTYISFCCPHLLVCNEMYKCVFIFTTMSGVS